MGFYVYGIFRIWDFPYMLKYIRAGAWTGTVDIWDYRHISMFSRSKYRAKSLVIAHLFILFISYKINQID
jgi:hypothetical protein